MRTGKTTILSRLCVTAAVFGITALHAGQAELPDVADVTGAVIDESVVERVYHVDQGTGDDAHSGLSRELAFRTITKGLRAALAAIEQGIATKVLIRPGIYREAAGTLDCTPGKARHTLLVVEGAERGKVIWEGSDVFAPATWQHLGNGLYAHDWPHDFGHHFLNNARQELLGHRGELVFVNAEPQKQIILEEHEYINEDRSYRYKGFLRPEEVMWQGTFGVAERDENGNRIYLRMPPGVDFATARIEVTTRQTLATFLAKENLVLRNLVVRRAANQLRCQSLHIRNPWPPRLLSAAFESGKMDPWQPTTGRWRVVDDAINQPGHTGSAFIATTKVLEQEQTHGEAWTTAGDAAWRDYSITGKVKPMDESAEAGIAARCRDGAGYALALSKLADGKLRLFKRTSSGLRLVGETDFRIERGKYCWLTLRVVGDHVTGTANRQATIELTDPEPAPAGHVALHTKSGRAYFDDVSVSAWRPRPANYLLDHCDFLWNNANGMRLTNMTQVTVRGCRFNYNGYSGLITSGVSNMVFEDNETCFNNWRGHWGTWHGRFIAGVKWHRTDKQIVRNHLAFGNLTLGSWYDIHCHDIQIDDLVSVANRGLGVFFEISRGPFLLRRSLCAHNGWCAAKSTSCRDVTVESSVFYSGTDGPCVAHTWIIRGDPHWKREPFAPNAFNMRNCVLARKSVGRLMELKYGTVPQSDYRYGLAAKSYRGNGNVFFAEAKPAEAFGVVAKGRQPTLMSLSEWGDRVPEMHARWADPAFVDPEGLDFRSTPGGPLAGRAHELRLPRIDNALVHAAYRFFAWTNWRGMSVPDRVKVRRPRFDVPSGRYAWLALVSARCPSGGARIHYTLDGSTPTQDSAQFTAPFNITETRVVRARAFKPGLEPSDVVTVGLEVDRDSKEGEVFPRADTYVRGGSYCDTNFGDGGSLHVKECGTGHEYTREAYLRFDLRALSRRIEKAMLVLRALRSERGKNTVKRVHDNTWRETAMTYRTRPEPSTDVITFDVPKAGNAVEVDVTGVVRAAMGQQLSLKLVAHANKWTWYASREAGRFSTCPRLVVTFAD